jgi:N-acetylneuraminic acid mutarotase
MNNKIFLIALIIFFAWVIESKAQSNQAKGNRQTLECKGVPEDRHENCFVEVGDKFYLLGGRGIKPVNIFDPKKNTWTDGALPPIELHHFQGVSYKGKIYVIGAMTGKYPDEKPISTILIYDPKADKWSEGDEIPENRRRGSAGVVVIKDKAILVSGIVDGHNGKHVAWVDEYDFKTGKWKVLSDVPRARDHFAAVTKDGKIYCAGGRNTSEDTNQTFELTIGGVDVYDIKSDSWESLPESQNIPTQRAGTSTVILGNNLIVIGGESGSQPVAHNQVEAFNIKTKSWRQLANLERGRHGTQAILYKNAIYIAAGCGNRGGKPELDSIEKFEMEKL